MKYLYAILAMASLTFMTYTMNDLNHSQEIQFYDMSDYEITIMPRRKQ